MKVPVDIYRIFFQRYTTNTPTNIQNIRLTISLISPVYIIFHFTIIEYL
jgi:hypothetical protein